MDVYDEIKEEMGNVPIGALQDSETIIKSLAFGVKIALGIPETDDSDNLELQKAIFVRLAALAIFGIAEVKDQIEFQELDDDEIPF